MAIYNYIDTIERAVRDGYPAEALNFNGVYFEDQIKGYQTLNVTGREAVENEIDIIETKARNGARYRSARYKSRTITVRYQIRAETPLEMMAKFNKLNQLLDVEEARLIFHDEPDKFFIGTRQRLSPPKEGELFTKGEIEFFCADPFKYSVKEYEVDAQDGVIYTFYNGTIPNPPVFRIRANSDIAFLEILKDQARLAIGLEWVVGGEQRGLRTMLNSETDASQNGGMIPFTWNTVFTFWKTGQFPYLDDEPLNMLLLENNWMQYWTEYIDGEEWVIPFRPDAIMPTGQAEVRDDGDVNTVIWGTDGTPLLSVLHEKGWAESEFTLCGTGKGIYLSDLTYKNFTFSFESRIYADSSVECGMQSLAVYANGTRTVVDNEDAETEEEYIYPAFGIEIRKNVYGTNRLEIVVYVDGEEVDTIVMQSLPSNEVFGRNSLECSLSRFGGTCTLRLGNDSYTYRSLKIPEPAYIGVYVCDYAGLERMTCNAIHYISFVEHAADTAKGIKNIIRKGSEIIIDCAAADIRVNGISEPGLGDISNEWDAMELLPGENAISIISIADEAPDVTLEYREAYI